LITEFTGELSGNGLKIAVVVSRFNLDITSKLLQGTKEALCESGVRDKDVTVVWVPGSFEIPLAAQKLATSHNYDSVICLGAVIKGETDHYHYISTETARGISEISISTQIPIIFGVLTTDTFEQALERAGGNSTGHSTKPRVVDKSQQNYKDHGNTGYNAGEVAVEMANLIKLLDRS
tara:strand:- start:304 stop:837 length:534 start_codon:yes stop_codon:yes gene_type:complete